MVCDFASVNNPFSFYFKSNDVLQNKVSWLIWGYFVKKDNNCVDKLQLMQFLTLRNCNFKFEPEHEKTNNLHMRKQRRRSASR